MNNFIVFKYQKNNISMILDKNNIPWFKGIDIAKALDYSYPRQTVMKKVLPNEKMVLFGKSSDGRAHRVTYINEPGVYRLIFSSKLPQAEQFKTWVFTDVLPRLRESITLKEKPLDNEKSLHYNIVKFIKNFYPSLKLLPGLGEYQDTSGKRCDAWNKGYIGGQPDIMIPLTVKKYNGLAIELKNPKFKSKVSDKQKEYHNYLVSVGWKVIVGNNYEKITNKITYYMNQVKNSCQICKKYYIYQKSLENHMLSSDHFTKKKCNLISTFY